MRSMPSSGTPQVGYITAETTITTWKLLYRSNVFNELVRMT